MRLRYGFGLTHLIVNKDHYSDKKPTYFSPSDEWMKEARAMRKREGFEVPRLIGDAGVFSDSPYVVLGLGRLNPPRRAP